MHTNISYKDRLTPAFDAVCDVKDWLGEKWETISPQMAKITNCRQFALYASLAGVQGYPVKAWYELYHGQGSWIEEEGEV